MPGNVGLIELTVVPEDSASAPTLAAAMQLIYNTEALILGFATHRRRQPRRRCVFASFLFPDGDTRL